MQIRVVNSRKEIFTLNPDEHLVHLTFRPSNKDIFGLIETCPNIEAIQIPKSYITTVSKSTEVFLQMKRIQLITGDIWGHRSDINEYYAIPSSVIEKIKEMKIEGKATEEIAKRVSRENKLNSGMVGYLMNKETHA